LCGFAPGVQYLLAILRNEIRGVIARVEQLGNEIRGLRSGGRPLSDGSSGSVRQTEVLPRGQLPFPVQMPGMPPGFVPDGQQGPPGPQMPQPVVPNNMSLISPTVIPFGQRAPVIPPMTGSGSPSSSSASTSHSSRSGSGSPRSDASSPSVVHYVPAPGGMTVHDPALELPESRSSPPTVTVPTAVPHHTGTDVLSGSIRTCYATAHDHHQSSSAAKNAYGSDGSSRNYATYGANASDLAPIGKVAQITVGVSPLRAISLPYSITTIAFPFAVAYASASCDGGVSLASQ
ncbi:hypothetical protein EDD18DRAFT_1118393, partial [Armillaria luteobubalina]